MKKITNLLAAVVLVSGISGCAFADGNAFTPLDFNNTTSTYSTTKAPSTVNAATEDAIGNENVQNAITEIDSAQAGIKTDLVNYKAKYSDVDAQYKLIKNERSVLKKQVKAIEKRIKELDKAKEKIRKNMI